MGLKGFICPQLKAAVPFHRCFNECKKTCHPLPTLLALANTRPTEKGVYHVTEIINPYKVTCLQRYHDYYRSPESLIYVTFGRAFHSIIEETMPKVEALGLEKEFLFEHTNSFKVKIDTKYGSAFLSGTPDLIIPSAFQIWDYKTGKYFYEVQKLLEGRFEESKHPTQLNIYRAYAFPEAKELYLEMMIKDYSGRVRALGVKPIEIIQIPIIPVDRIEAYVHERIENLLMYEKYPEKVPDCTPEETWNGIRCNDYCDGSEFCVQGQLLGSEHETKKTRKARTKK